jgi:hypothetical protein
VGEWKLWISAIGMSPFAEGERSCCLVLSGRAPRGAHLAGGVTGLTARYVKADT